jgi:transposase InsO family protein
VDNWSRRSQLIEPDFTLTGTKVVAALERVAKRTGYPQMITVDNGSEFTSKALDAWAHEHGVKLDFIRPGKPVENAVIESFNGRFRDECLNTQVFAHCMMLDRRLKRGGSITMSIGRIVHWGISRPRNLSSKWLKPGCRRHRISSSLWSSFWGGLKEAFCSG